jgi:hypothetical protein
MSHFCEILVEIKFDEESIFLNTQSTFRLVFLIALSKSFLFKRLTGNPNSSEASLIKVSSNESHSSTCPQIVLSSIQEFSFFIELLFCNIIFHLEFSNNILIVFTFLVIFHFSLNSFLISL